MFWSTSELRTRFATRNWFQPSNKISLLTVPRRYFFCGSFVLFMSCVCHTSASGHCCLLSNAGKGLTSWFLFVMFNCVFVTFSCGILGQVWYLIVVLMSYPLYTWTSNWCATFNSSKTESVLFSRKLIKPIHPALHMNQQQISTVTSHKHLGLVTLAIDLSLHECHVKRNRISHQTIFIFIYQNGARIS